MPAMQCRVCMAPLDGEGRCSRLAGPGEDACPMGARTQEGRPRRCWYCQSPDHYSSEHTHIDWQA